MTNRERPHEFRPLHLQKTRSTWTKTRGGSNQTCLNPETTLRESVVYGSRVICEKQTSNPCDPDMVISETGSAWRASSLFHRAEHVFVSLGCDIANKCVFAVYTISRNAASTPPISKNDDGTLLVRKSILRRLVVVSFPES